MKHNSINKIEDINKNSKTNTTTTQKNTGIAEEWFEKMKKSFQDKLSPEEKEKYEQFGKYMYQSFDFTKDNTSIQDNCNDISLEEALAYVTESLKSGLHPKYLTEDEKVLMEAGYGKDWYEKWNY